MYTGKLSLDTGIEWQGFRNLEVIKCIVMITKGRTQKLNWGYAYCQETCKIKYASDKSISRSEHSIKHKGLSMD